VLSAGRLTWQRMGDVAIPAGPRPWFEQPGLEVADERAYDFFGIRQDWTVELDERLLLKTGFEARRAGAEYDYFSWGQSYFLDQGAMRTRFDTTTAAAVPNGTALGAYVAPRIRPWQPLVIEAGAEWSRHSHTGESKVNPRLNAALTLGRTTVRAAWGKYTQIHGLHELPIADGESAFFAAERAEHRVASVEHVLPGGLGLRVEAYERRIDEPRPRFVNLDNTDDVFPELTMSRTRIDPAAGRARGVEFVVSEDAGAFTWGTAYALSRSEELVGGRWVPGPRDQRHALALDAAWSPARKWRFAASWQYHSGWPYTPQVAIAQPLDDGFIIGWDYGPYNSERLAAYHRMDVRVSRHFDTRRGRLSLFLDVWNIYDHANERAVFTSVHGIRNGTPLTHRVSDSLLPRLPSFGIFWEF
jgi:hypothetical protein